MGQPAEPLYRLKAWYEPFTDQFRVEIISRRGKVTIVALDRKRALRGRIDPIIVAETPEQEMLARKIQEVLHGSGRGRSS